MLWRYMERGMESLPVVHSFLLQMLLGMVLVFTVAKCSQYHRYQPEPTERSLEWGLLCLLSLLLALALGKPVIAGIASLVLEAVRKLRAKQTEYLDWALAIWSITLGILLAQQLYEIAFLGTILPCLALWTYFQLQPIKSLEQQYIVSVKTRSESNQKVIGQTLQPYFHQKLLVTTNKIPCPPEVHLFSLLASTEEIQQFQAAMEHFSSWQISVETPAAVAINQDLIGEQR